MQRMRFGLVLPFVYLVAASFVLLAVLFAFRQNRAGLQDACRQSLDQRQKVLQGALKACKTVDAVLALVAQCNPSLLNVRIVSAALQRLARCASDHFSALQALHARPEFQRILSLAQHGTPQMEWRTLVTVARALAKLKCAEGTLLAPIEGT